VATSRNRDARQAPRASRARLRSRPTRLSNGPFNSGAGRKTAEDTAKVRRPFSTWEALCQDREPHPTRDGAPPARVDVPRRSMRSRQGENEGRASAVVRPAGAWGQATRPPRPRTRQGRRATALEPGGIPVLPAWGSAHRAKSGATPPLGSGMGPRALVTGALGSRGGLLTGRGGWREAEGFKAVSGPPRPRCVESVSG